MRAVEGFLGFLLYACGAAGCGSTHSVGTSDGAGATAGSAGSFGSGSTAGSAGAESEAKGGAPMVLWSFDPARDKWGHSNTADYRLVCACFWMSPSRALRRRSLEASLTWA
jgi:hypothetical protein